MKNVKLLGSGESVLSFINSVNYGSSFIEFENDDERQLFEKCVDVVNIISKGSLTLKKAREIEIDGETVDVSGQDIIQVIYSLKEPTVLMHDDVRIGETAKYAADFETVTSALINEGLHAHAKKIAKKYGVKFRIENGRVDFDGSAKLKSIYKRMESALMAGEASISFDLTKVSGQTVRVYTSNLSSFYGKKFKASANNNIITVYFSEVSKFDVLKSEAKKMWDKITVESDANAAEDIFRAVLAENVAPEKTGGVFSDLQDNKAVKPIPFDWAAVEAKAAEDNSADFEEDSDF